MTQLTRRQTLAYEARRVAQTRRTFANWPTLLSEMAGEALLRVPRSAGVIRVGR